MRHVPYMLFPLEVFISKLFVEVKMLWIIPFLLFLGLTLLAILRDVPRVTAHLESAYRFSNGVAFRYAKLISSLIYLPAFAYLVLGTWLGETHRIGAVGACAFWVAAPIWWFLGYLLTGGGAKAN